MLEIFVLATFWLLTINPPKCLIFIHKYLKIQIEGCIFLLSKLIMIRVRSSPQLLTPFVVRGRQLATPQTSRAARGAGQGALFIFTSCGRLASAFATASADRQMAFHIPSVGD